MSVSEPSATSGERSRAPHAGRELEEKPQNGLEGLEHWRHDLLAGVVVSLVSLPLSSGIAIASGAPPIYGLISSIIAGLIYPFLGGSYVTISGPAAGLAPALVAVMVSLGGAGDAQHVGAGYHKLLVVICLVGVIQIILGRLKLAKYAAVFPAAVVEGMLAAIGVLIFVKAIPLVAGVVDPGHPHGFLDYVAHVPSWISGGIGAALAIGLGTAGIMLLTASKRLQRFQLFRTVPPHLWAVAIAIPLGFALQLRSIEPALLISVPDDPLSGISVPAFSAIFSDPGTWKAVGIGALTLLLIDGVESLATAQAVDRIDPFRRVSDPDRVLLAMGVSNLVSSLLGGLTVIPGGVKSKTNIEAGGRTLWSNFVNALMLLTFLFVAPGLISMIPTAALGGILLYTGWKMAHPAVARHMLKVGPEQLALYVLTLAVTLLSDLLVGVAVGTAAKCALVLFHARGRAGGWDTFTSLFRDPFRIRLDDEQHATVELEGPFVCFNAYRLRDRLADLSEHIREITLKVTDRVPVIDHTACEALLGASRFSRGRLVSYRGLEALAVAGAQPDSMRLRRRSRP